MDETERYPWSTVYDELQPLLVILRICGLLPILMDKRKGGPSFRWLSVSMVWSLAVWLACAYTIAVYIATQVELVQQMRRDHEANLFLYLYVGTGVLMLTYVLLIPATIWWETRNICTIFNQLTNVQVAYAMLEGRPLRLRLRRASNGYVVLLLSVASVVSVESVVVNEEEWWAVPPFVHVTALILGVTALWCCLSDAVVQACTALAATLSGHHRLLHQPDATDTIRVHRLLWMQILEVVKLLGNGLSRTMGSNMLWIFSDLVSMSFSFMSLMLSSRSQPMFAFVLVVYTLVLIIVILAACNASQNVVTAVKCQYRDVLFRLPSLRMTNAYAVEMELFLETVHHMSVDGVSVAGFFKINRSTFVNLMSMAVTYLVILVQLVLMLS